MGKKGKKKRISKALRAVRIVEAVMLGEELPMQKVKVCEYVPPTLEGLCKMGSTELRAVAYDLQIYDPPTNIRYARHNEVAAACHKVLACVGIHEAPGTIEGLLELGSHRLRRLAGCFITKTDDRESFNMETPNASNYYVPRRKNDLTDEEIAQRLLHDLKALDKKRGYRSMDRPARLSLEDLFPPVEVPPPAPKAKELRLFEQRLRYTQRNTPGIVKHVGPGNNKPGGRYRKVFGKRQVFGHKGTRPAELRCGCKVTVSISKTDFVWLSSTSRPCSVHARTPLHGALHTSLLKKEAT